jgi:Skp family chaperone for outer membrane proteins
MPHLKTVIAGGLLTITATYAVARFVSAQGQPAPQQAAAKSRIAIVNLEALLQNFKRAQAYKTALDRELQPVRAEADALKEKILKQQGELRIAKLDAAKRKELQEAANKNIKKLDELQRHADKLNNQKVAKEFIPLYKEILEVVKTYARAHGIQVVLSYAEDPKIDPFSFASIGRKVNGLESTGCVTPIYVDPGADITAALTDMLNRAAEAPKR